MTHVSAVAITDEILGLWGSFQEMQQPCPIPGSWIVELSKDILGLAGSQRLLYQAVAAQVLGKVPCRICTKVGLT